MTTEWYNTDWLYRKKIQINSSCIASSQTNFPILYKISGIGDDSISNGTDIIFTGSGNTRLHHDLISFSGYSGNAWVQVSSLTKGISQVLYMYWGNTGGGDQTAIEGYKPSSTWDNTYAFVCHMKDAATSNDLTDSTKYQLPLKKRGSTKPSMVKSFLGSGQLWNAGCVSAYAGISSNASTGMNNLLGQGSIEAIISGHGAKPGTNRGYIFLGHNKPTDTNAHALNIYTRDNFRLVNYDVSGNKGNVGTSAVTRWWPKSGTSRKTTVLSLTSRSGAGGKTHFYIEGGEINNATSYTNEIIGGNMTGIYIGVSPTNSNYPYSGAILDIRVSNVERDGGWIKTNYLNISSLSCNKNSVFYTIETTESAPAGPITTTSFNTKSGSAQFWRWGKVELNTGTAPRSPTANSLSWAWGTITGDSNTYIPSGSSTWWGWCLESK